MKINNPTLRLRKILGLLSLIQHLLPKEKAPVKKTVGRHFRIWDTGSSSDMLDDSHLYHLEIEPVIGSDMLVWQSDSLYYGRNGQVLSLERLRLAIPPELVGHLNLMLSSKQNRNKRGKKTQALVHETTIDAEIPTEIDPKIIPFRRPAA